MLVARPPRHAALRGLVDTLWLYCGELAHPFERVLPSARMQLLVSLCEDELREQAIGEAVVRVTAGAAIQGARARPFVIDTRAQRAICGVSFSPGGARPFIPIAACELGETTVDAAQLWGRHGAVLCERVRAATGPAARLDVLECALLERLEPALVPAPWFERAHEQLEAGTAVGEVERRLGLSPRRFIAQFRERVGLTPNRFARVARFQRVVRAVDGITPWAVLASAHGYADQAHMIREFKEFAGITPTAYRARSPESANHVAIAVR